jgi:hypothetical protein
MTQSTGIMLVIAFIIVMVALARPLRRYISGSTSGLAQRLRGAQKSLEWIGGGALVIGAIGILASGPAQAMFQAVFLLGALSYYCSVLARPAANGTTG